MAGTPQLGGREREMKSEKQPGPWTWVRAFGAHVRQVFMLEGVPGF